MIGQFRFAALFTSHGLDIERWFDLITKAKDLRRETERIAEEYKRDGIA